VTKTRRVTVQRTDCQTRANIGPAFASLLSFAKGGTFTEIPGTPTFLPGQRTAGVGVWTRTGERSFKAVSEAFILFDSVSPPYALISPLPPSFPLFHKGKQRITQTIEVNGDESTADAFVPFFDTNGKELSSICADAALHRLEIDDRDPHALNSSGQYYEAIGDLKAQLDLPSQSFVAKSVAKSQDSHKTLYRLSPLLFSAWRRTIRPGPANLG
jgi:hypothetical protein